MKNKIKARGLLLAKDTDDRTPRRVTVRGNDLLPEIATNRELSVGTVLATVLSNVYNSFFFFLVVFSLSYFWFERGGFF